MKLLLTGAFSYTPEQIKELKELQVSNLHKG